MVELNAVEYLAFVKAGKLLAELGYENTLAEMETFPLVSQTSIDAMKSALVVLVSQRAGMQENQRYQHNDICLDVAHLKALK